MERHNHCNCTNCKIIGKDEDGVSDIVQCQDCGETYSRFHYKYDPEEAKLNRIATRKLKSALEKADEIAASCFMEGLE